MKIIATVLGFGLLAIFNTGCSTSASVGHNGHSHGVSTSASSGGVGARVF